MERKPCTLLHNMPQCSYIQYSAVDVRLGTYEKYSRIEYYTLPRMCDWGPKKSIQGENIEI